MGQPLLVLNLILFGLPQAESLEALGPHQRERRYGALGGGEGYLVVDEGVVEADLGGVASGVGIVDALNAGPIDGAQAHRAGLTGGVYLTPLEVEVAHGCTGCTNGAHLGVGCGVVEQRNAVGTSGHNLTVAHDDSTKGAATSGHTLFGEFDGHTHKFVLVHSLKNGSKVGCL